MKITTTLDRSDLERIAAENHVQLHDYRPAGHERGTGRAHHGLTIRPAVGDETYRKLNNRTGRRVWAVCWHGHFAFMAGVFGADPAARIRSAMADYRTADEFYRLAPDTRWVNVGSAYYPAYADDECAGNHGGEWGEYGREGELHGRYAIR